MLRLLRAALPALLLAGLIAAPVGAAKPQPNAMASVSSRGCEFVVSYSWAKFAGRNLVATVGLYERSDAGDQVLDIQSIDGQVGRTGSVSFLVSLTADVHPEGRTLLAIGALTDPKTAAEVAGANAESATIESTCG
jgi:hypothetical protein